MKSRPLGEKDGKEGRGMIKLNPERRGKMTKYWSTKARGITPYTAGEQPRIQNILKLNTNENPYPPSPKVAEAIKKIEIESLRLYPDPESTEFRRAAAELHNVQEENVFCGNGSDEVLAIAFDAFFDAEKGLKIPDISYSFYPVWASLFDIPYEIVPLNEDFTIPVERFFGGSAVFPNPNAPTGIALDLEEIERVVQHADGAVIIDEAYQAFGAPSAIPLVKKYPNLLVVRTLSKSHGLAGIRAGYAVGDKELIQAMRCIKDSFNSYPVDRVAQAAAAAALQDAAYTENTTQKIIKAREYTTQELAKRGFSVLPSKANFVFAAHAERNAAEIMAKLREKGIIVRRFDQPRIGNYLRITIGTQEEMERLVRELDVLLKR